MAAAAAAASSPKAKLKEKQFFFFKDDIKGSMLFTLQPKSATEIG
jgi:hypothetical protein